MAETRGYSAARFVIVLEGQAVGILNAVEGGEPFASVVTSPEGDDQVERKELGLVSYEPLRISFGSGMGAPLYKWIAQWLQGGDDHGKSGAIVMANYNFNEQSRLSFENARITEVRFPALDAAAKEPALFTVTLQPERARIDRSSEGAKVSGFGAKALKQSLASNFRLRLGKLSTSKVNKVDALIVRRAVMSNDSGELVPAQVLQVPDLVVTLAESDAKDYFDWFEDFAIKGNGSAENERSGTIELLAPSLQTVLFSLTLSNLGIFRVHRQRSESGAEVNARVCAQMYCEQLAFSHAKEAVGSEAAPAPTAAPPASTPSPSTAPLEATQIARRLIASVQSTKTGSSSLPKRDEGAAVGARWATETATLDELEQIAALEPRDWSAIRLADQHSLIAFLAQQGVLPAGVDGALDLQRDSFIEGIVAGAAQILRSAAPHLDK